MKKISTCGCGLKKIFTSFLPALILMCVVLNTVHAQYVQTGPALIDTTALGINLQAASVAISANGQMAVAGYPYRQHSCGGFTMYQRNGNQWNAVFNYAGRPGQQLGGTANISAEGSTVVLGSQNLTGSVDTFWVFYQNGTTWQFQFQLTTYQYGENSNPSASGPQLSYDGNTMTFQNNIYTRNNGNWSVQQSFASNYSFTQISADGNTILGGKVIYRFSAGQWTAQDTVKAIDSTLNFSQVQGLLSGDGNTFVANCQWDVNGIPTFGLATFKWNGNKWIQQGGVVKTLNTSEGFAAAISYSGNIVTYSVYFASNITFANLLGPLNCSYGGGTWQADNSKGTMTSEGPANTNYFTLSIDSSGTLAMMSNSATDTTGGIKFYTYTSNAWTPATVIRDKSVSGNSGQGISTVMSADGSTLVYSGTLANQGAVWAYSRNGAAWTQQALLQLPDTTLLDEMFGNPNLQIAGATSVTDNCMARANALGLAADGNTLAVAVPMFGRTHSNINADHNYGAIFIYNRVNSNWIFNTTLTVPANSSYTNTGYIGTNVAISGDGKTIIAGTSQDGAFVFINNNGNWDIQQQLVNDPGNGSDHVAISYSGDTAAVSEEAYNNNLGAFHVYIRQGSTWQTNYCCRNPQSTYMSGTYPTTLVMSADGKYIATSSFATFGPEIFVYQVGYGFAGTFQGTGNTHGLGLWMKGDTLFDIAGRVDQDTYGDFVIDMWVASGGLQWNNIYQFPLLNTLATTNSSDYFSWDNLSLSASADMKYVAYSFTNANYGDGGVYIYENSNLNITLTDSISPTCTAPNAGKLAIAVSGGAAPVNIAWSTGAGSVDSITNLAAGTYSVTVTDADSVQLVRSYTLSLPEQIQVVPNNGMPTTGGGDSVAVVLSGGTFPYTISWGDGTVDTISTSTGTHLYNAMGSYFMQITDSIGCATHDTFSTCMGTCVWPGDANYDGMVNNLDLLNIGLGYDSTGFSRPDETIGWYAHFCQEWPDTFTSAINYKNADCDGNGVINADDTTAILANYSLTHIRGGGDVWRSGAPVLSISMVPDTLYDSSTVTATLFLGDSNTVASNVYGLAFTFNFDQKVVDTNSINLSFSNSWLFGAGDHIAISKQFSAEGQLQAAATRIDHANRSGSGPVATVIMKITTGNINGKDYLYYKMRAIISSLVVIDNEGNILQFNAGSDSAVIGYLPTAISTPASGENNVRIFPNPNQGKFILESKNYIGQACVIYDLTGRAVHEFTIKSNNQDINVEQLSAGTYLLEIKGRPSAFMRFTVAR